MTKLTLEELNSLTAEELENLSEEEINLIEESLLALSEDEVDKLTIDLFKDFITESKENTEDEDEEHSEEISEDETAAARSIKAHVIQKTVGALLSMSDDDAFGWFKKQQEQFGHFDAGVPEGAAGHNKSTIVMKPSDASSKMEDFSVIFDGQELTEEFKDKATFLFENSVNTKVSELVAEQVNELTETLTNQFEISLNEELNTFTKEITEDLDLYLTKMTEQWLEENKVEIESAIRNELMDDFISGLKTLFVEHYVDIPEEKINVIEQLSNKIDSLQEDYDSLLRENANLEEQMNANNIATLLSTMAEGLTATQTEKFMKLAENVEFDGDFDSLQEKLEIIKETHFKVSTQKTKMIHEDHFIDGEDDLIEHRSDDPDVDFLAGLIVDSPFKR